MPGYFDDNIIDNVRQALDIAEVISGYLTLKRKSQGDWWGLCPFHAEKTSSFHVRSDLGMYHCFGCGKGGNVFTFLMEMEGVSFPEALRMLAERAGIELPERALSPDEQRSRTERDRLLHANSLAAAWFHSRLLGREKSGRAPGAERALQYLKSRGIDIPVIRRFQIGWAGTEGDSLVRWAAKSGIGGSALAQAGLALRHKDGTSFSDRFRARIIFPIHNLSGKPVAFGGRLIEEPDPESSQAKYINSPETALYTKGDHLYGLNQARDEIRRAGFAYLVEGYTDLLALVQAGSGNAVASLGTALTSRQAQLLRRFTSRVNIVYDSDTAGIAAASRAADILTLAGIEVRMVRLPQGEDPDSLFRSGGKERLTGVLASHISFVQFRVETVGITPGMGHSRRIEAARGLLETIRNLKDPLMVDLLLKELSEAIGIRQEMLDRALAAVRPRAQEPGEVAPPSVFKIPAESTAERDLVRALLGHPELASECPAGLQPDQISHPPLRELYRIIEQSHIRQERLDTAALPDKFSDPAVRSFITEAVMWGDRVDPETARIEVRRCAALIASARLKQRCEEIETEVAMAAKEKRPTASLLKELIALKKQLKELQDAP